MTHLGRPTEAEGPRRGRTTSDHWRPDHSSRRQVLRSTDPSRDLRRPPSSRTGRGRGAPVLVRGSRTVPGPGRVETEERTSPHEPRYRVALPLYPPTPETSRKTCTTARPRTDSPRTHRRLSTGTEQPPPVSTLGRRSSASFHPTTEAQMKR